MDFYQISDLERLSGIKAHTIRIWEKRFEIIHPNRTDTNIRLYNDAQLKKLLNIATLINAGLKISKIAALSEAALKEEVRNCHVESEEETKFVYYTNGLIEAMLDFDEAAFNQILQLVINKNGFYDAVKDFIFPFLNKTGLLWSIGKTIPAQEHFASMIIKRLILKQIQNLPLPSNKSNILLFLPANEWHELGLLFAEFIIRNAGFRTINLGQNVPFQDIAYVIEKTNPIKLLTFLTSNDNEQYFASLNQLLKQKFKETTCFLAGNQSRIERLQHYSNIKVLYQPGELLKYF